LEGSEDENSERKKLKLDTSWSTLASSDDDDDDQISSSRIQNTTKSTTEKKNFQMPQEMDTDDDYEADEIMQECLDLFELSDAAKSDLSANSNGTNFHSHLMYFLYLFKNEFNYLKMLTSHRCLCKIFRV